jgi:hypothetical protein
MHGKTLDGSKFQEETFPLMQEAALEYTKERLNERIENRDAAGDFLA